MLRHRLILGPLMIVAAFAVLLLDSWLARVDVSGTWLQTMLGGRSHLPAGLGILALGLALVVPAARELSAILRATRMPIDATLAIGAGALGMVLIYLIPADTTAPRALAVYATAIGLVFALALVRHCGGGRTDGAMAACGAALLVMVYLGVLPSFYLAIRQEHAVWVVLAVVAATKACDIGAYFTGLAIGRHKLIPWLSPGKTWEGLVGGMVLAGVTGAALASLTHATDLVGHWTTIDGVRTFQPTTYPIGLAAVAGLVLGGVGQLGDLAESLFKRDAGVKDSGATIPGFGGVLDVVDSPIIVAPVAYWLLQWLAA